MDWTRYVNHECAWLAKSAPTNRAKIVLCPVGGSRQSCLRSLVEATMPGVIKPNGPGSMARFFNSPFIRP